MSRKFKRFFIPRDRKGIRKVTTTGSKDDINDGMRFYRGRKLGQIMVSCSLLKTKPGRFKHKMAMWQYGVKLKEAIPKKIKIKNNSEMKI